MTDSNRCMTHAALVAVLVSSPLFAASDPAAIEQQLNALQQALARQQEQLAQQQQEIERLRQQIAASSSGGAVVEQLADEVQQAKLAAQDAPRVTMTSARPTISSADGRSSIALRSVVQLDAANYSEDSDGGIVDFRRGSVGAAANRETTAARDLSNGAYFRRARFGFEGTVARDFPYRVIAALGAPAPKVRRASTISGSATRDSGRSRSRSAHSRRPPTWTPASTSRARCSSNAPRRQSCLARWAAPTAVLVSACAAAVRAG